MRKFLSSRVAMRSFAIIMSIAMLMTLMPTSLYVKAATPDLKTAQSAVEDVALIATATANAEHSEWGILATNLNNGHEPTKSSNSGGSWHDYGIESTDGISWVQYDWDVNVTVDKMSIYWMCDGVWEDRIPKSAQVQYKDQTGTWQTAASYDASVMSVQVKDQYNELPLDKEITTKCIRMTMVRNKEDFCSIHRWKIWGHADDTPISEDPTVTEITDGYRLTNKYFIVETGKYGQITSLKLKGDTYPTNYVLNTKNATSQNTAGHQWMGELMFSVKKGDAGQYIEENTSRSDTGRKIELKDNKVIITYENATGEKSIKDFKVVETYSLDGNKLHWDITVTNTNDQKLTIGDWGIPLPFNEYWPGGEQIYETRTVDHSFVGKQSSYIYVTRPSGIGKYLLMTPDISTGAGFEYQDHWRTSERAADEAAWCQDQGGWANGLNVFYIHSDNIKKTNRGYLENTKLELEAGQSKTYSFNFSAVDNEANMKSTLYEEGIIDAVAVPGMAYSVNMPGKLYLHTKLNKDDISFTIQCPHETGLHTGANTVNNLLACKKTNDNTYVKYEKTVTLEGEQYHVYDIHFADLGQNNVIVKYNSDASETVLQFYMMDDVAAALTTHAEFMVDQTQWNTPLKVSDKVFDDWMMDTKNKRAETDPTYWQKNYWGWGDDWGLTHGEYIAEKNVYQPVSKEISAVDEYLDIAIWNGLMREHQKDYLIHDFLMESPNSSPNTRGYAYPHIYNTYFSMYKIASKYPDMIDYKENADTYLLRAYNILKALYGSTISYNYSTGLMGELTTPDIIAALEKEGYYTEAQKVISIMADKYKNFKDTKYPYGSEYAYDNTGEEAVYTLAKLNHATDTANANTMMSKIDLKTRACRGLQPLWYQYANPTTNCGENWWQFQYTASLAGYCMDDWLRLQDNSMTESQKAAASRVNYAAKLANLTSINSGQIDADPANIGAVAWTYQAEMGNMGGQGTGGGKLHNGWRQMSGEADLGLYGALQILSSDVVKDPVFGLFGYGCNVTENNETYTVTPLDGLFTRLNFINQELYIELDRDQYTQAKVTQDNTSIKLNMKNLEGTAHKTDVNITGLVPGSYQVSVDGNMIGSFQAVSGETSKVSIPLPAEATAQVSIKAGSALSNKAPSVMLEEVRTVAISDKVRMEADASDDGYVNSTLTYRWEVVNAPEGGNAVIADPAKCITGVTFNKEGKYVLQFTADDGGLSTAKKITVTVTDNPLLPENLVNYTFDDGTIVGTNLLLINSNTGFDYAELDDNSILTDGRSGKGVQYKGSITGGYVELPEELTKNLSKATISMDIKLSEVQANHTTLFELGDQLVVEFVNGNELVMTVNGTQISSYVTFAEGYWKNVELTAQDDNYILYVDGVKKAELKDTGLILSNIDTETERYLIGRSKSESEPFLKGIIDNFNVKSVTMTEDELKKAYGGLEHTVLSGKAGSVITTVGNAPVLPVKIDALYSDGVYEKLGVTWDTISPSSYANIGNFMVNGKITGTDIVVTIKVIVTSGILQNIAGDATPSAIVDTPSDLGGVKGLNDGFDPTNSRDTSHGAWHNWRGNQGSSAWVMYSWDKEQIINGIDIYFFKDGSGNFAPANYRIEYQNENGEWNPVTNSTGLGVLLNQYNYTSFDPIVAKAIRIIMNPAALGCGVIEWKVYGYKEGSVLDKSSLNTAIATAEGLDNSLFISGMDNVNSALITAKAVAADKVATQESIDAAAVALNNAISLLVPVITNNLAYTANVSTSFTSSWENTSAVNDGAISSVSNSTECTHWGTWGNESAYETVTYTWGTPVKINSSDIYLWTDGGGIEVPSKYVYQYLDKDGSWKEVSNAAGYEVLKLRTTDPTEQPNLDGFNNTTFDEVTATAFRVSVYKESPNSNGVGLVEWRVYGTSAPQLSAPVIITNPTDTSALPNDSVVKVSLVSSATGSSITASDSAEPAAAVSGTAIYYTLDGSKPSAGSIPYQGEFQLSTTQSSGEIITIKAIEIRDGWVDSNVVQKQVIFKAAATPTTTPPTPTTPPPVITTTPPVITTPVPTATPTSTPGEVKIPEGNNSAFANLTFSTKNDTMEILVEPNKEQLVKQLTAAKDSDSKIKLPMITNDLIKQLKDNKFKKLIIVVTIPKDILTGDLKDYLDLNITSELLQVVKDTGIDLELYVKDDTGKEIYSWSFASTNLPDKILTDINLFLSVDKISDKSELLKLLTKQNRVSGMTLNFNKTDILPCQASVRIYVGNLTELRNTAIYLYHYNMDTNKLETLPYSSKYLIDSEGYITLNLMNCYDYVILTKPADKKVVSSLLDQVKVAPQKATLYVGGTKGSKASIKVTIPNTLRIVSSFSDQTINQTVGEVKVSYRSSNKKVAVVDSNGNITAVGVGTASIITKITLYNNKTVVRVTKITVKKAGIHFVRNVKSIQVGKTYNFAVEANGLDEKNIEWKTTNKSVIVVDQKGKVTAKSKGKAYIIVHIGKYSKKIKVLVK